MTDQERDELMQEIDEAATDPQGQQAETLLRDEIAGFLVGLGWEPLHDAQWTNLLKGLPTLLGYAQRAAPASSAQADMPSDVTCKCGRGPRVVAREYENQTGTPTGRWIAYEVCEECNDEAMP